MSRRSSRNLNQRVNYRQLTQLTTSICQSLVAVQVQRWGHNTRNTGAVETTVLPVHVADDEVQSNFCKMKFTKQIMATQEHNHHHPDCQLFTRSQYKSK